MALCWTWGFEVVFKYNLMQFLSRPLWRHSCGKRPRLATSQSPSGVEFKGHSHNFQTKIDLLGLNVKSEGGGLWIGRGYRALNVSPCHPLDLSSWWDVVSSVSAVKLRTAPEGKQSSLGKGKVGQWLCVPERGGCALQSVNGTLLGVGEKFIWTA